MDHRVIPSTDHRPYLLGKSMEELRHSLLCTTLELEYTRNAVKEEMERHEQQAKRLLQLLNEACRERDEAKERCRNLLENLLLPTSPVMPEEMTNVLKRVDSTTSECDSLSRFSTSTVHFDLSDDHRRLSSQPPPQTTSPTEEETTTKTAGLWSEIQPETEERLPKKGKLLQAVVDAGPLLQTLLLAGPLPQWRHPPPPLSSYQIPPVDVTGSGWSLVKQSLPTVPRKRSPDYHCSGDQNIAEKYRRLL